MKLKIMENYMMEIPFWTGPIRCIEHETFLNDQQAIDKMQSITPLSVNIKMYSSERISIDDSFKMIIGF